MPHVLPKILHHIRLLVPVAGLLMSGLLDTSRTLPSAELNPRGTILASWDNDILAGSDDDYTNGLQVGWVSGYLKDYEDGPLPGFMARGAQALPGLRDADRQRFISYSLSHRIFTPGDLETSEPIEDDLPYSAILTLTLTTGAQSERHMDAANLTIGIVGPAALGEEIQNGIHSMIGSTEVQGWDNQIDNELLINVGWEHRYRALAWGDVGGWRSDVILQGGATLGNLMSQLTAGVGLRFGWNLPDVYGIPPQFASEETIGSRPWSRNWNPWGVWFFALLNGSAIGNAIFGDGNTFQDGPSIDYDPYIGRFYAGIRAQLGRWGASFGIANTTVPWENPDDKTYQSYGRFGLSYSY